MKYVIWGAGLRGKRLFYHLRSEDVLAFVDKNVEKEGKMFCGKEIISLEKYISNYSMAIIIIAHVFEDESVEELKEKGINRYMKSSDCPGEFQEENIRFYLNDYIKNIVSASVSYGIYGCTVYSLEVYRWLSEAGDKRSCLILDNSISPEIAELIKQYGYRTITEDDVSAETTQCILNCKDVEGDDNTNIFKGISQKNIYDCSDVIKEYYNSEIENLKDIHKNESCVIVATGPSLRVEDLNLLNEKQIVSFGVNKIGYIYRSTIWRPTYYVGEDSALLLSDYFKDIRPDQESKYAFLGDTSEAFWKDQHDAKLLKYHLCAEWTFGRYPKFSEDLSRKAYLGGTIVYTCIQLAVYMGFKEIYLLGVDFTGANAQGSKYDHFYPECELTSVSYTDQIKLAYEKAKLYADEHGIKIYNATRGGRLEVFERVDFDSVF